MDIKSDFYCCRTCFFTASALNAKNKFIDQVNYSFGGGGMTCGFESNNHVAYFIQFLKRNTNLVTKDAVTISGRQLSGTYALNSKCFIDENGKKIEDETLISHVWLNREAIFDSDKIIMDDVTAKVDRVGTDTAVDFFISLKKCLNHNFLPGLLVVSGGLMSFHYLTVIELYGGCAITVATGDPGTGKSTSISAALAMFGCAHNSVFSKGTNAGMLERSSRSTLPYGIDDPSKGKGKGTRSNALDIGELCIDLYNGQKTINLRSGTCKPVGTAIVSTNFDAGELDR